MSKSSLKKTRSCANCFEYQNFFDNCNQVELFGFNCISGEVNLFVKALIHQIALSKNRLMAKKMNKSAILLVPISMNDVVGWIKYAPIKNAISQFALRITDGMPLVWLARLKGNNLAGRLYGPTVMKLVIGYGRTHQLRHFFYGGTDEILELLVKRLAEIYPGFKEAGRYAPPFRDLDQQEFQAVAKMIDKSQADVVWIGIGSWRQIMLAVRLRTVLKKVRLVAAVGAAFDFISGVKPQAPAWIQNMGLEWLYRLVCEPRRLWRRYLLQIPSFIVFSILDVFNYYKLTKTSSKN